MPPNLKPRLIKAILGMNGYDDSTSLQPGIVKLIQNMIPRKTTLDTREGWTKYNTIELPPILEGVFGIATYSPTLALNLELAVCNGKLYSGDAGVFTERYSGLSANTLCSIIQYDDIAIVADQVNKMVAYRYGDTPYIVGIDSPKDYKLIENFEDASLWTMTNGTATNDKAHQIYGTQCINFLTSGAVSMKAYKAVTAINLTVHSDGSTSSVSDYISLFFIRGVYANYTNCYLDLITTYNADPTLGDFFSIRLDTLADWKVTSAPNVAFELKIRKSAFISGVGSPNWASIVGIRLRVTSTVAVASILDFCRLEKTGPIPSIGAGASYTACTVDSTTDIITSAAHGLSNGDRIYFAATTLPGGIISTNIYYIVNTTLNTFQVSLTSSGVVVDITSNGTAVKWTVANVLMGTYWYRVTYMTIDGWESDPSVDSDPITVTATEINLTVIPVPGSSRIASKKIYRLGGTSAEWRLLTILYGTSTTTYTDNTLEADLGDIQDEVEGYPYIPKCMTRHNRAMVIANLTDLDGTQYPCGVMVSREESIDIYDHLDFFEIEANFGASIKWLISAMDFVYVGKNDSIWKFDPQDLTLPPRNVSRIYSGVGPLACCAGENEFYFLDPNGVVSFNGSFFEIISDSSISRGTSVKNYLDLIPPVYLDTCWMLYYNNFLLIGIPQPITPVPSSSISPSISPSASLSPSISPSKSPSASPSLSHSVSSSISPSASVSPSVSQSPSPSASISPSVSLSASPSASPSPPEADTYPTLILAYYVPKRFWFTITGWNARCGYAAKINGINTIHLGHATNGFTYNCFSGDDDDGIDITSIIQTADDDFDTPESRKDFAKLILWARKLTSTDVPLTIEPSLDTVDLPTKSQIEIIDSLTNKRSELGVPDLDYKGTYLGLKMIATKRWSFRTLAQWARLEPPPI